jgi:hypothetical protein
MDLIFLATIYLILLVIITIAVIFSILRYKNPPKDYATDSMKLSEQNTVANYSDVKDNFLVPGTASLVGFFYIEAGDRTGNLNGDMRILINLGNIIALEISPVPRKISQEYVKSGNSLTTTAQLRLVTYGDGGFSTEQISLPDIPLQKWICIGILKDGRRIDVVFDDKIVASRRLAYNIPVQPYGGLVIGQKNSKDKTGLRGQFQHVFIMPERLNINDFVGFRDNYINSAGDLVGKNTLPIPFLKADFSVINIPGLTGEGVSSAPPNTLKKWYTPYN